MNHVAKFSLVDVGESDTDDTRPEPIGERSSHSPGWMVETGVGRSQSPHIGHPLEVVSSSPPERRGLEHWVVAPSPQDEWGQQSSLIMTGVSMDMAQFSKRRIS